MKDLLLNYTKYNLWANTKVTGFLKKLTPELWNKELKSSFPTIRETLYHIWDAELIWYDRLKGISLSEWPSAGFKGSNDEFIKSFLQQSGKFIELIESKSERELNDYYGYKNVEGKSFESKTADSVLHCMNHSTFHRGQIVTMLRNAGFTELNSTDYIMYTREMKL